MFPQFLRARRGLRRAATCCEGRLVGRQEQVAYHDALAPKDLGVSKSTRSAVEKVAMTYLFYIVGGIFLQ
jgi:hypothetical protein